MESGVYFYLEIGNSNHSRTIHLCFYCFSWSQLFILWDTGKRLDHEIWFGWHVLTGGPWYLTECTVPDLFIDV